MLRARVARPGEVVHLHAVGATSRGAARAAPLATKAALAGAPGRVVVAVLLVTVLAVVGIGCWGVAARRRGVKLGTGERDGHRGT